MPNSSKSSLRPLALCHSHAFLPGGMPRFRHGLSNTPFNTCSSRDHRGTCARCGMRSVALWRRKQRDDTFDINLKVQLSKLRSQGALQSSVWNGYVSATRAWQHRISHQFGPSTHTASLTPAPLLPTACSPFHQSTRLPQPTTHGSAPRQVQQRDAQT